MRTRRDSGASLVEYGAIILLVGAILSTGLLVVVPDRVKATTLAAICEVFQRDADCAPAAPADPPDAPPPDATGAPPVSGVPVAVDPDVQKYIDARNGASNAEKETSDLGAEADKVLKELFDFLKDVVGITDVQNCVTKGDIVACLSTLVNIVPWGKVLKLLKKIPGAIKLAKRLKKLWDDVSGARKRKEAADKALTDATDALKKKKAAAEAAKKVCRIPQPRALAPPGPLHVTTTAHRTVRLRTRIVPASVACPTDVAVIGRLPDTAVMKGVPGYNVLDIPGWTIAKNDAWVNEAVAARQTVYVSSPLTHENLWDAVNNRPTVLARELDMFTKAGYTWDGYYLIPPKIP